jgi:hypothetical protein
MILKLFSKIEIFSGNSFKQYLYYIASDLQYSPSKEQETMSKNIVLHLLLVVALIPVNIVVGQNADSTRSKKLQAGATFSLNSNGISSVPAFSLGKPAAMASVYVGKGWFSYDPTLAYSLDGRPWFIDNWFHVKLLNKPKFELRTGMNVSTYCSKYKVEEVSGGELYGVERYFAFELATTFRFGHHMSLLTQYWNDRGQEDWSIKGHFLSATVDKTDMALGKLVLFSAALQLFYINYEGNNDGLFVAPRVAFSIRNFPVSVFSQVVQAISSNIEPFPGFNINVGIAYTL